MTPIHSAAGAEFLEHYQRDTTVRWSAEDLAAQRQFVHTHVAGRTWLDWSSPAAGLQLVQSSLAQTAVGTPEKYEAIVLAGPVVELVEPVVVFKQADVPLESGGKLIGIIPCLRDNSPESQRFMEQAAATLWPYYTGEELLEMLRESGWLVARESSGFVAVQRFKEAVRAGQLGFTGFGKIFERLMAEGYDPMEVGWGELRFVAVPEEGR
jgi:hypothetical protein